MDKEMIELLRNILEIDDIDSMRIEKLKNCKYLIIIDMGCGSTSAAILDLEGYTKSGETSLEGYIYPISWFYGEMTIRKEVLHIKSAIKPSIPTLIGYSNLKAVIGPEALETGNLCENFKACPDDNNLKAKVLSIMNYDGTLNQRQLIHVWPDYFAGIIDQIYSWCAKRNIGPKYKQAMSDDTILMVAHPAGEDWSEASVLRNYRNLIMEGTGLRDENILTISEAKAAMQFIRRKYAKGLDFSKGVVIIDIGASTIDIEYLAKKISIPIEYSLTMAGRDVDKLLMHYYLETVFPETMKAYLDPRDIPDEKFFIDNLSMRVPVAMFEMRRTKENISSIESDSVTKGMPVPCSLTDEGLEITGDTLRSILGDELCNPLAGAVTSTRSFSVSYPPEAAIYIHNLREREGRAQTSRRAVQVIEDTWYGHLENIVRFAMDDLAKAGHQVSNVIVTGGSCLLTGIKPHIWNAISSSKMGKFICSEEQVSYMDAEYDYENSVPFGGGYYVGGLLAHLDLMQAFPKRLYDTLFNELREVAAEKIAEEINGLVKALNLEALEWWRKQLDSSETCSVNAFNKKLVEIYDQNISKSTSVEHAVENAIKKINPKESLVHTKKEIEEFLEKIAGAQFTGKFDVDSIQISISADNVVKMIRTVKPESFSTDFWANIEAQMENVWNGMKNLFGKGIPQDDIQRSADYRNSIYNTYKGNDCVTIDKWDLKQMLFKQLEEEFQKTDIFGIPSQILHGLKNDIMCALYLNDAVDDDKEVS